MAQIVHLPLQPPESTPLPIVNPTPYLWLFGAWLKQGAMCAGGFPLWLAGGAPTYADIDLYVPSWEVYYPLYRELSSMGPVHHQTDLALVFHVGSEFIQLTKPVFYMKTSRDLMECSDLSADACALVWQDGRLVVEALYPEDIASRTCRILIEHSWTPYRKETYEKKGYHVSPG